MATNASESVKPKGSKRGVQVIGRSTATGRYLLGPASSKGAKITIKDAMTAAKSVRAKKK